MEKTNRKIDIWSIFMYLILYSIAGFFIETTFGMITKGVIESRKSFLYGPFCAIYGIGAISMILVLKNEKNIAKIFIKGAIVGAFVEYMMSFLCERYLGVKWWDYSGMLLNINGRTCLFYAVSWGLLAIVLIKIVNPNLDNAIDFLKQKNNIFKCATAVIIMFLFADAVITGYTLKVFYYRIATENNLKIENIQEIQNKYNKIQNSQGIANFLNQYYNNGKILKTYPNMMIESANNTIYIGNLIDGIKPYYYRLGINDEK